MKRETFIKITACFLAVLMMASVLAILIQVFR